jgi:hypothetical protein
MLRSIILLVVSVFIVGCAALLPMAPAVSSLLSGPPPNEVHQQTDVRLEQNNFMLVRTNVYGQCKGFALLGIITMVPATLTKAVDRLYASAQMSPYHPQAVANVIIERSSSYWILFSIPKVEVHADVVEFRQPPPTNQLVTPVLPYPNPPGEPGKSH